MEKIRVRRAARKIYFRKAEIMEKAKKGDVLYKSIIEACQKNDGERVVELVDKLERVRECEIN